jgi:hypothetical protein
MAASKPTIHAQRLDFMFSSRANGRTRQNYKLRRISATILNWQFQLGSLERFFFLV